MGAMYAICDCDSCYCSCERVFRPDLNGRAVVVLSNNDGCVVARSKEAKRLGVPMGIPYYQMLERFPHADITAFSSNYELYDELTRRVMSIIRDASPGMFRYSIDEAFCFLDGMEHMDLKAWGEQLSKKIMKWVGIPVSIGIAPTKTLAKCADRFAKDYAGYKHCCLIDTEEKRVKALSLLPVKEVWGIGRQFSKRLESEGIHTALDLAQRSRHWVRAMLHVTGERTWMELNGIDCVPLDDISTKKSICTSRSFPGMVSDLLTLRTHVANYAARCAEKLRKQHSVCQQVMVFIASNHFREDLPQYDNWQSESLLTPVNTTQEIIQVALKALERIFREGIRYKRAGVIVEGITSEDSVQTNFLDFDPVKYGKLKSLTEAVDKINRVNGRETIVLGSQQYTPKGGKGKADKFADVIKHDLRSPNFTTRWSDILIVK